MENLQNQFSENNNIARNEKYISFTVGMALTIIVQTLPSNGCCTMTT